ncbi:TonB family protein [Aestuariirhabdus sp. Z084]|uniref:energy transducer TonB n=1 Tax=Aestuariirhabdus haliotis TaxID=2918751 RepID=UPI00201B4554|nr:energy transducer TonB [Aestuariirhabdus haliotis]MCL6417471.1 TonB family protein [Aestuariirhabdus haliotis]MCL6421410.1 TonB family protein [Aestuariirhabdus haliotis]
MLESGYWLRVFSITLALGVSALVLPYAEALVADAQPTGSIARQSIALSLAFSQPVSTALTPSLTPSSRPSVTPAPKPRTDEPAISAEEITPNPQDRGQLAKKVQPNVSKSSLNKALNANKANPSSRGAGQRQTPKLAAAPEKLVLVQEKQNNGPEPSASATSSHLSKAVEQTGVHDDIEREPSFRSTPQPPIYPRTARKRGQQGIVWLDVWLDSRGEQTRLEVFDSSGVAQLDRAAVQAVARWEFEPRRVAGRSLASRVRIPVHFTLN